MGDLNGHNPLWGSKTTNDKGKKPEGFLSQEGEGKKQMGAWNQSLEFMKIVLDPPIINDCGLGAAMFKASEDVKVPCVT